MHDKDLSQRSRAYPLLYHEGFTWDLVWKNPHILAIKFDHSPYLYTELFFLRRLEPEILVMSIIRKSLKMGT